MHFWGYSLVVTVFFEDHSLSLWSNISIKMALFSRPFLVQTVTVSDSTTWSRDDAFEETSKNFSLHLRPFQPIPVEKDASS